MTFKRFVLPLLLLFILPSCAPEPPVEAPVKPKIVTQVDKAPKYNAKDYLISLSHAKVEIDENPSAPELGEFTPVIQGFSGMKKVKTSMVRALIISYSREEGKGRSYILWPLKSEQIFKESELLEVMRRLNSKANTIYSIYPADVSVAKPGAVDLASFNEAQVISYINSRIADLMETAILLPPVDQTQRQIELTRFFMRNNFRDAAYLSLESSKRLLELAISKKVANDKIANDLAEEIDFLNGEIRKRMPYKL